MAVGATQVALSLSEAADLLGFTPSPGLRFQPQHLDWLEFGVKQMKTLNCYCVHILYYLFCVANVALPHWAFSSPLNVL